MEYTPINPLELCDGEWHKITANKDGVIGTLVVDNNEPELYEIPNSDFQIVNVDAPLYAGGVPGMYLATPNLFVHLCIAACIFVCRLYASFQASSNIRDSNA